MRCLLVVLTTIVALSLFTIGRAQSPRMIASDQDGASKSQDEGKGSPSSKPAEASGNKESSKDKEQRLKREKERDEDAAVSGRYGKSIRASATGVESSKGAAPIASGPPAAHSWHHSSIVGGLGGMLSAVRFVVSRYLVSQHSARAATR
jgi:hypothetical protein